MEEVKKISASFERVLDTISQPLKPYFPPIARFLIVVTFLEDSIRIMTQWNDQIYYLSRSQGMSNWFASIFLFINVIMMICGSTMAIFKKMTTIAVGMLVGVVFMQSVGYGLIFHFDFFFRNLSVLGGLLLLLSESMSKKKDLFAGLPQLTETEKSHYVQLAGRVLLVMLFLSFLLAGEMSVFRILMSLIGFAVAMMVVVGFKAKYSAMFLVLVLSSANVLLNNWWSLHHNHPDRYAFI
jgi:ER-derived vesicles protein